MKKELDKAKEPKSLEEAMAAIENIIEQIRAGKISLQDSISAYKHSFELLEYCQKQLAIADEQVRVFNSENSEQN